MDGLDWSGQQDFSAGAWPLQERVPYNAVEDCVNGLFDDDGSVFKRGGGAYKGAVVPGTAISLLWDGVLAAGQRTVVSGNALYVLAANDTSWVSPGSFVMDSRPVSLAGILFYPYAGSLVGMYAGSRKTTFYSTGTATFTAGSKTVTGAGTSWSANVDAGMILADGSGVPYGVVQSVDSNTQITMRTVWGGATVTGVSYIANPLTYLPVLDQSPLRVAATANRLVFSAAQNRIYFSAIGNPFSFDATDFHEVGEGSTISGLFSLGDGLLVFTTLGVHRIGNMAYDLTDALGNVQQTITSVAPDVILWGDGGLVGMNGAVLVPAVDGLYSIGPSGVEPVHTAGMGRLWRQYVKAGYVPGQAAVHRGHYFLPILSGTTFVDLLVLKMSTGAWSRWSGHSAGVSFAQRGATSSANPKLLAAQSTRVLDLTATFEPAAGNKSEADGTTHTFTLTCRTVRRRDGVPESLRKVRVRYELDDAASDNPTIAVAVATGRPGSAFTTLTGSGPENVGQTPKAWRVGRRGTEARVRITSSGPSSSLVIRSVEQAWYPSGRQ